LRIPRSPFKNNQREEKDHERDFICPDWFGGGLSRGAYKDSPHESFLLRRFLREIVIALVVAVTLAAIPSAWSLSLFVLYVVVFALARLITKFWKLFLRVEPQGEYRIPTQIHWVKGVVHNPWIRILMGTGMVASIYGCYKIFGLLPDSVSWPVADKWPANAFSIGPPGGPGRHGPPASGRR